MPQSDKDQVKGIFSSYNYLFIVLSLVFCWISHYSRAVRWSYMLEPLGYQTNKWNNYHAVISGYFVNMVIPRGGEVTRAGIISRYEKIPFEKAFGTIMAERVIDVFVLLSLAITTILIQGDKYPEIMKRYNELTAKYQKDGGNLGMYIMIGIAAVVVAVAVLYFLYPKFKTKINSLIKGFADGLLTIIRLKKRWAFLGHTLLIWTMYLSLYWICFLGIDETSSIDPRGMLLGFLAGGISIIIVPGGIGVYPVFVAAAISIYCDQYGLLYGLGWLAWLSQTALIVVAGMISLYIVPKLNVHHGEKV